MTIYLTGPNPNHLVHFANNELQTLYQWCLCNRLTINTTKTYFIVKKTLNLPHLQINNNAILKTNKVKFLGITYDDSLTFRYHIHNITLNIYRHIALLYQVKDLLPPDVLKIMYYAHFHPLLTYCNPIGCTTYPTYLIPLKLQLKKIVRIITNSNYLEHTNYLLKGTKISKLDDITKLAIATYMYANKNTILHPMITTRHCHNLTVPQHRLTKFQHSVLYLCPVIWNSAPFEIQNASCTSVTSFKYRFKCHILATYYSTDLHYFSLLVT